MSYIYKILFSMIIFLLLNNHLYANTWQSSNNNQNNQIYNISQQTGGNYIYAEDGKLTFNLEPSLFNM